MGPEEGAITWHAHEHQPLSKSTDWFWALGIISVGAAATSIILGNVLFGILILAAGVTIGVMARQDAREHTFALTERYLAIDDTKYKLDELRAFWITDGPFPLLLIDTPRIMTPDLVIPLDDVDSDIVRAWFLAHEIPEKELRESLALKILELFGF